MKLRHIVKEILDKLEKKSLVEGLIQSYDVNRVISILWRAQFESSLYKNELNRFIVRCDTDKCDFNGLFKIIEKCGWYPAYIYGLNKSGISKDDKYTLENFVKFKESFNIIEILFEPRFDVEFVNIPKYLYHFTKKINWYKISKKGLNPRTQSKTSTHPERVYLSFDINSAERFGRKVVNRIQLPPEKSDHKEDYSMGIIIRIDTNYCKDVVFYEDPNYKNNAVYCLNSIHPMSLEIVKEIDLLY